MTTITIDRATVEQALEACEQRLPLKGQAAIIDELNNLRAALAQQTEPDLSRCPQCNGPADNGFDRSFPPIPYLCTKCMAEPVEPVEPVAWMYTGIKQDGTEHGPHLVWKPKYMDAMSASKGAKAMPLYTAPPQRKPLTEEEMRECAKAMDADPLAEGWPELIKFARAVERAHGIKE